MLDPTREELITFLESEYAAAGGDTLHSEADSEADNHDGCGCRFEIECAAYYLATHYHGGQWSNLYSASSTSPYSPGMAESELPDNTSDENCERYTETLLYQAGAEWIEGGFIKWQDNDKHPDSE